MELSKVMVVRPDPDGLHGAKSATHTIEIMNCLDRAMAGGYEGVMFKSLNSIYAPGARDGDWMKLKPDYVHDMGDELDLLIIAGYYGEGQRRQGGPSHFLLGLQAPASAKHIFKDVEHPRFYPFCKVGTGYTVSALQELRKKLEPATIKWDKRNRPAHLCGWVPNKTDDEPDVWFEPAKSVIFQVGAYEMVKGEAFMPCGYTLRFPRVRCIRHDKPWNECETHDEVVSAGVARGGEIPPACWLTASAAASVTASAAASGAQSCPPTTAFHPPHFARCAAFATASHASAQRNALPQRLPLPTPTISHTEATAERTKSPRVRARAAASRSRSTCGWTKRASETSTALCQTCSRAPSRSCVGTARPIRTTRAPCQTCRS